MSEQPQSSNQNTQRKLMPSPVELNIMMRIANGVVRSGIGGCNSPQEAFAKILTGWGSGLDVATSLNNLKAVEGRMTLPELVKVAAVRRSGIGDVRTVEANEDRAVVEVTRSDWPAGRKELVAFTIEDAVRGGLVQLDAAGKNTSRKDNWRKWTTDMLLARARGTALRRYLEEASAGLPYSADEIGAETDEDGNAVVELDQVQCGNAPRPIAAPSIADQVVPPIAAAPDPQQAPAEDTSDTPVDPVHDAESDRANSAAPAADPFANGLKEIEERTLREDIAHRVRSLLNLVRFDAPTWKTFLSHHYGASSLAQLTIDQGQDACQQLDRLYKLDRLRHEMNTSDADFQRALSKRGVDHLAKLSPQHAQEMVNKLMGFMTPFRIAELGLNVPTRLDGNGGQLGNGSTPTTAGAQPPALQTQPQESPVLEPVLT